MNAEISETIRATVLGLAKQIPAQRKFVSELCHAHSNAHKPPKTVARFDARIKILTAMNWSHQYLSIDGKNSLPRPL